MANIINMIQKYWQIGLTILVAYFLFAFNRRGQKIEELHRQVLETKINDQLSDALSQHTESQDAYAQSLQKYRNLRDYYNSKYRTPSRPK